MIIIDGTTFDVPVMTISRRADFLDKYAERTEDGVLHRELIGVYFNYQIQFGSTTDVEEYAALWDNLTEPEEFHSVEVPGAGAFQAYFSNVGDVLRKDKNASTFWKSLTVNFIAQSPTRS
jgi:phosphoserine aminotransferase